jgi:hypothetical protein
MAGPVFHIKANETDMANIRAMLADIKTIPEKVISRGLNKTLTGVKTDASTEVRKVLNVKKAAVDETFKITKASVTSLSCAIKSTGKPLALIDFTGTRQTKVGVSVLVKKEKGRKVMPGAFIAQMKSGHKGVYWRDWHGDTAPAKGKKRTIPYAKLPAMYRLPIRELFGPRAPDILENDPVMGAVLKKADERLHKNLQHELEYELSKL